MGKTAAEKQAFCRVVTDGMTVAKSTLQLRTEGNLHVGKAARKHHLQATERSFEDFHFLKCRLGGLLEPATERQSADLQPLSYGGKRPADSALGPAESSRQLTSVWTAVRKRGDPAVDRSFVR
jgi:hypothetical protein